MQPCLVIHGNKCSYIPGDIIIALHHEMCLTRVKTQNGRENSLLTFFLAQLNVQWFPNGFPEVPVETTSRGHSLCFISMLKLASYRFVLDLSPKSLFMKSAPGKQNQLGL